MRLRIDRLVVHPPPGSTWRPETVSAALSAEWRRLITAAPLEGLTPRRVEHALSNLSFSATGDATSLGEAAARALHQRLSSR